MPDIQQVLPVFASSTIVILVWYGNAEFNFVLL